MKKVGNSFISLRKQFIEAWGYVSECKTFIWSSFFLFVIAAIVGFISYGQLGFLNGFLKDLVAKTSGLSLSGITIFILQNNLQSSLFGLFGGIFLGIFPLIVALINGVIVGYVLRLSWNSSGFSELWRLFPHGIFELPAVFISIGLGVKLGGFIFSAHPTRELKERLYKSVNVFLFIVIPLLIIAAIIEGLLIHFL